MICLELYFAHRKLNGIDIEFKAVLPRLLEKAKKKMKLESTIYSN